MTLVSEIKGPRINGTCHNLANRGLREKQKSHTHSTHFIDALIGHIGFKVNRKLCA